MGLGEVHAGYWDESSQMITLRFIIDYSTGKIYDGLDASWGVRFRQNSCALISRPEPYVTKCYLWRRNNLRPVCHVTVKP